MCTLANPGGNLLLTRGVMLLKHKHLVVSSLLFLTVNQLVNNHIITIEENFLPVDLRSSVLLIPSFLHDIENYTM